MTLTLTPRQREVVRIIAGYRAEHRISPTLDEIAEQLGVCKVTAFGHVDALVDMGVLLRGEPHKARTLRLAQGDDLCPCCGQEWEARP